MLKIQFGERSMPTPPIDVLLIEAMDAVDIQSALAILKEMQSIDIAEASLMENSSNQVS